MNEQLFTSEIVQQALQWHMIWSIIHFTCAAFCIMLATVLSIKAISHIISDTNTDLDSAGLVVAALLLFLGLIAISIDRLAWFEILIAPKWYVVEHLQSLLK